MLSKPSLWRRLGRPWSWEGGPSCRPSSSESARCRGAGPGLFGALLAGAILVGSCSVHMDPSGTNFRCDSSHPCPPGYLCLGTGFCAEPDWRCGLVNALADAFDDNWRGEEWWASIEEGGAVLAEEGGRAVAVLPSGAEDPSAAYYQSSEWFVWEGSRVYVEAVQSVSGAAGARAFLALAFDGDATISIEQEGDQLFFRKSSGGTPVTLGSVRYEPAAHRWWQIRAADGRTQWQTSADGFEWTTRFEETRSGQIGRARIRFGAAADSGVPEPGTAVFDNLNGGVALGHTCRVQDLHDDFEGGGNDGWRRSYTVGGASRQTAGGVATVTLAEGAPSEAAYMTSTAYSLVESGISIEIVETPTPEAGVSTWFRAVARGGHFVGIRLEENTLYFEQRLAGVDTILGSVRYSAEEHVYWGIGQRNGEIRLSTSRDRQQWVTEVSVPQPFGVEAVGVAFGMTSTSVPAQPASATFDNVR